VVNDQLGSGKEDHVKQVNYQTVRLGRGKHTSPSHGVCVMELASMLANEPFTDHPRSVSRPIAAFLRMYNDALDDRRRQDLYRYAAAAVGTAADLRVEQLRAQRLLVWADERRALRRTIFDRLRRHKNRAQGASDPEAAARYAAESVRRVSDTMHERVLALVDDLIAIGSMHGHPAVGPPASSPFGPEDTDRHLGGVH
jgi:hypothetical protein